MAEKTQILTTLSSEIEVVATNAGGPAAGDEECFAVTNCMSQFCQGQLEWNAVRLTNDGNCQCLYVDTKIPLNDVTDEEETQEVFHFTGTKIMQCTACLDKHFDVNLESDPHPKNYYFRRDVKFTISICHHIVPF